MSWKTENNTELPMRFTKVELREQQIIGSDSLGYTFTNENGYYYFVLNLSELNVSTNNPLNLFVRTYTESSTFDVAQPFREQFNYFDSHIETISTTVSGIVNISRTLKSCNWYMPYRLTYIQQGMVVGERFALDMGMQADKKLYVFYIDNLDFGLNVDIEYNGENLLEKLATMNITAFCYDTISFIGYNKYNSFSTTIHEYGHYVENRMGNYGPAVKGQLYEMIPENYTGPFEYISDFFAGFLQVLADYYHTVDENHFADSNTSKAFQMELTWSEAWATAFAEMAMQKYSPQYIGITNYSFSHEHEAVDIDNESGEAQEKAVIQFLWDLYDYTPSEAGDNIYSTEEEWWEITTETGTYTLQDFTNNILDNYHELIDGVGEILRKHQISPNIVRVTNEPDINTAPSLEINLNGSSSYPNNRFKIAFYDEDNNLLALSNSIVTNATNTTYPVMSNIWNTVMEQERVGTKVYAVIYGYRYETYNSDAESGPYFSSGIKVYDANGYHSDHAKTYINISASSHTPKCSCGVTFENEAHYSHRRVSNDGFTHNAYCVCGYLVGTQAHSFVMFGGTTRCRYCSYVRPTSQVIMGKEDEEPTTE